MPSVFLIQSNGHHRWARFSPRRHDEVAVKQRIHRTHQDLWLEDVEAGVALVETSRHGQGNHGHVLMGVSPRTLWAFSKISRAVALMSVW